MRPLVDELEELEQLAQPSDGEKSRQDEITIQLKGMKGEYARADERTKESESAKGI